MPNRALSHLRGNVVGYVALVIALSGTSYAFAVADNSVRSRHIVNGQVKTPDIGRSAVTGAKIKNGTVGPLDLAPRPSAKVERTDEQVIPQVVGAKVVFQTELWDTGRLFTLASPDVLVIKKPGRYLLVAEAAWQTNGTGNERQIWISRVRAGSEWVLGSDRRDVVAWSSIATSVVTVEKLERGDRIHMGASHDDPTLGIGLLAPSLAIHRLSP
jgi:hypothetical protein